MNGDDVKYCPQHNRLQKQVDRNEAKIIKMDKNILKVSVKLNVIGSSIVLYVLVQILKSLGVV